jgi:hypothetical protein
LPEVVGELQFSDISEFVVPRKDASLGDMAVHFSRVGYAVRSVNGRLENKVVGGSVAVRRSNIKNV